MKFYHRALLPFAIYFLPSSAWCQSSAAAPMPPNTAVPQTQAAPSGFFYYCAQTKSYYPSVAQCDAGWIAIPVSGPPPPIHQWYVPEPASPQEAVASRPHVFSLELEGRALNYSFNYDQSISDHYSLGIGISNWQQGSWWDDYQASVTVLPIYLTYYFSSQPNRAYLTFVADVGFLNSNFAFVINIGLKYPFVVRAQTDWETQS